MRLQRHHQELTNGVGKCSKPMWQWGMPCFCDEPAYGTYIPGDTWRVAESGELRRFDGRYCGYVPALACPAHGGPDRPVTSETAHFGDPCDYCKTPHDNKSSDLDEVLAYLAVELLAPILVRLWADMCGSLDIENPDKLREAIQCAANMERWASDHPDHGPLAGAADQPSPALSKIKGDSPGSKATERRVVRATPPPSEINGGN